MIRRLLSFWEGLFARTILVSGRMPNLGKFNLTILMVFQEKLGFSMDMIVSGRVSICISRNYSNMIHCQLGLTITTQTKDKKTNKQTKKQRNKETHKQTNKQTNKEPLINKCTPLPLHWLVNTGPHNLQPLYTWPKQQPGLVLWLTSSYLCLCHTIWESNVFIRNEELQTTSNMLCG